MGETVSVGHRSSLLLFLPTQYGARHGIKTYFTHGTFLSPRSFSMLDDKLLSVVT